MTRGVDSIVEIGGPGTIAMSLKALSVGGHVSLIGASLSSAGTGLDPLLLTGRGITLGSTSVGSRADFDAMNRATALHRLRPLIDRDFRSPRLRRPIGISRAAAILGRS
jgi:NADPH:quinone reductase-like Zn-dependent oxidoreductase